MRFTGLAILGWSSVSVYASPLPKTALQTRAWTDDKWDIIVVGAGPAGIITADRLSEAGKKVLLLEQGGPSYAVTGGTERPTWLSNTNQSRVDVPGLYSTIFSNASPTLMCGSKLGAYGACTLGGNSAINAGLYFQPPASDWDTFHPSEWKSADVNNATKRLLSRQPTVVTTSQDGKYYLQSGWNAVKGWLVGSTGYAETSFDVIPNNKYKVFGRTVYDYIRGNRGGPVRTYLQSAKARTNFLLQSGVQVRRVVRSGRVATGVFATVGGNNVTIGLNTNGRVILSGGALFSPQLLMLSAIGDAATLTKLNKAGALGGVPASQWINNTNVGYGLFDNPNTFIGLQSPSLSQYAYSYDNPPTADRNLYLNSSSGPYSFAGQTSAFWTYINHTDGTPPTGVQGTVGTGGYGSWANNPNAITLNVYGTSGLLSKGRVTISSTSFTPGVSGDTYYSNPRDADDIAQFIYDIFQTLPQAGLTPINIAQNSTKEQIRTYITTGSAYARGQVNHFSSSCRIGTCVDSKTRVIGMDNLHVVDGSIVAPLTVNPQMGIMIAAERASELILGL